MASHEEIEYTDELVAVLETVWGDGFLSPGGPEEVAMVMEGSDISGLNILDIGCGVGGIGILLVREYNGRKGRSGRNRPQYRSVADHVCRARQRGTAAGAYKGDQTECPT